MNNIPKNYEPKKGIYSNGWGMLLWWKINPEEIDRQVEDYNTLKITQSARGLSFLLCVFSLLVTPIILFTTNTRAINTYYITGVVIADIVFLVIAFLIYKGQRWAIIIMMIWWTFEKFSAAYDQIAIQSPQGVQALIQIIWWSFYMHAFYVALKVENLRRKKSLMYRKGVEWLLKNVAKINPKTKKTITRVGLVIVGIAILGPLIAFVSGHLCQHNKAYVGSKSLTKKDSSLLNKEDQKKLDFINACLVQIANNYNVGNNKAIEGTEESKMWHDDYGNVTKINLSNKLYIAKGYFEKMHNAVKNMKSINNETINVKDLLIKAAETRIESIDLYTKGLYLQEQIGKTSRANTLTVLMAKAESLSPAPIPQYNGEVENGLAKISIANSYMVDALRLLENMISGTPSLKLRITSIETYIASLIGYFSDVSETDYDKYVKEGDDYISSPKLFESVNVFEAIISYSKALKIKPKEKTSANAYSGRGLAKQYLGDYTGAIEDYNKAIEIDPENGGTYYMSRGLAKQDLQDYTGAIENYDKAIELDPKNDFAYYNRGLAKQSLRDKIEAEGYHATADLGYHTGAIEDYDKAIEINKINHPEAPLNVPPVYYCKRGAAKYSLQDYKGAIEDFNEAFPCIYADEYYIRGLAKQALKDKKGALEDLGKAAAQGKKDAYKKIQEIKKEL